MRYEIRPLGPWIGPVTTSRSPASRFTAPWTSTLDLLGRETDHLGARLVVVQVDVAEGGLRRDGMLRAGAKVAFPGVRVSFDSRHGPLTYATDAYAGWQSNVRAIALGLEALRAVDRYGVSKSGEQYRGWSAIAAGPADAMSANEAARLLAAGTNGRFTAEQLLADRASVALAYKLAIRTLHPDVGGDAEMFRRVTAARDLLNNDPI
ncbi:hypothetical protein ACFFX1_55635 [Dactylosporangium sucinum]|uniref:J domain-containing protein n=1 Tax=Dactylosporangium sucinum TaxID=1424081 RepID=A0A917U3B1_9ACTN|nr:molecular chaperone DnaJ [Dactylosporangium sucinum]GGM52311.1 hypothetical protein GCM10007977_062370 [Dactylosporangium sucinum]